MFPRPVASFAGRRPELDRVLRRLGEEPVFVVYGVGGIGKTEFVFRAIDEVRRRPGWEEAQALHLPIRAGSTASRVLSELLEALGARSRPRGPTEQLSRIAELLEARPWLLFLDDVHHLDAASVSEALGYLSRRLRRSRLFVASRCELAWSRDAAPPVITTLGPLDDRAVEEMLAALTANAAQSPRDRDRITAGAHGSPFHVRLSLFRAAEPADPLGLASLAPDVRRALLVASLCRLPVDAVSEPIARALSERFLIDAPAGQLVVHELVRDEVVAAASGAELRQAHMEAAAACATAAVTTPLSAVDAVGHWIAAGRFDEAFAVVERHHPALRAAGAEHLLDDVLDRLREALPTHRARIDLLAAQGLARASLFGAAEEVLARIPAEVPGRAILAGEIALHRGDSGRAIEAFERAVDTAEDAPGRFHACLRLSIATTLAVSGAEGRAILDLAMRTLSASPPGPTPKERAREALARTASFLFDEAFEQAHEVASVARRSLPPGLEDTETRLAMLETLAAIESDDLAQARAAAQRIDALGVRRIVAALYQAILAHAEGRAVEVADELAAMHARLFRSGDAIHGSLAGHHGSAALAEIGRLGEAIALADENARRSAAAGLHALAARALSQQALLAAEAMQTSVAHELADRALAHAHLGPRSRARAHAAHSRAFVIEGEIDRARGQLAAAHAAVTELDPSAHAPIWVEEGAAELVGGSLDRAVERSERAVAHCRGRSRAFDAAHALLVLAAASLARGRRSDASIAEHALGQARARAERGRFRSILVGCAILGAAHARRVGVGDPDAPLAEALVAIDPERGSIYASTLLAAIDGGIVGRAAPGIGALLAHLGFSDAIEAYLVDRTGRRAASAPEVERARVAHELFVDARRAVLVARHGAVEIAGRPMVCAMLGAFVQADGAALTAEALHGAISGGQVYHPLRHRNALYVGLNRLRACLQEVFPGRPMIERDAAGWRLVDGVDACVALPVRTET